MLSRGSFSKTIYQNETRERKKWIFEKLSDLSLTIINEADENNFFDTKIS